MRRARVVLLVTALASVFVVTTAALALAEQSSSTPDTRHSVRMARLPDGVPVAIPVRLPTPDDARSRVVLVRGGDAVRAFLAVDPRIGCGLLIPGDPDYGRLFIDIPSRPALYDNCTGSAYGIDGVCNGGPCRRNLDEIPVRVDGDWARLDVRDLRTGSFRFRLSSIPPACLGVNPAAVIAGPTPFPRCR